MNCWRAQGFFTVNVLGIKCKAVLIRIYIRHILIIINVYIMHPNLYFQTKSAENDIKIND